LLFIVSFAAGSALMLIQHLGPDKMHLSWQVLLSGVIALEVLFVAFMVAFTRGRRWNSMQRFALMAGGLCGSGWTGFLTDVQLHGAADLPAHGVIAAVFAVISGLAWWRASRPANLADKPLTERR
ncbi:MAG: hypothetical protein ACXU8O_06665, partial [Asticcacaulis sp.]